MGLFHRPILPLTFPNTDNHRIIDCDAKRQTEGARIFKSLNTVCMLREAGDIPSYFIFAFAVHSFIAMFQHCSHFPARTHIFSGRKGQGRKLLEAFFHSPVVMVPPGRLAWLPVETCRNQNSNNPG